jgi:hypothetical protein
MVPGIFQETNVIAYLKEYAAFVIKQLPVKSSGMKNTSIALFLLIPVFAFGSKRDSIPGNMLVINSFDVASSKMRKNKKELFLQLTDSLKQILSEASPPREGGKIIVVPDLVNDTDSTIQLLMSQNNATKAIVIKNLNAFFNQTQVDVTKEPDGKKRTASYDICAIVTYRLYRKDQKVNDAEINTCEFFTQRNVMSGLLAAGPDIVGKKEHAFKIVRKNALEYISTETPWK